MSQTPSGRVNCIDILEIIENPLQRVFLDQLASSTMPEISEGNSAIINVLSALSWNLYDYLNRIWTEFTNNAPTPGTNSHELFISMMRTFLPEGSKMAVTFDNIVEQEKKENAEDKYPLDPEYSVVISVNELISRFDKHYPDIDNHNKLAELHKMAGADTKINIEQYKILAISEAVFPVVWQLIRFVGGVCLYKQGQLIAKKSLAVLEIISGS